MQELPRPTGRVGAVLADRYHLERLLGAGGTAEVYAATDRLLQRSVAIKVLRDQIGDPSARGRFTSEARTVAQLSHPGLVAVLDASTETDPAYLVLELVDGQSLAQALSGPLPPEQVAQIGAQLADALAHAHAAGIVHRDVKPGNVLLGGDGRVRLTDFGIARLLAETSHHTATGLTVGTVAYISPEQVRGDAVTPAADVYALGVVLIEALTGQRPFSGTTTESLAARLHAPPPVPGDVPARWRDVLERMTRLEPDQRPTAAQAAVALSSLDRPATGALGASDGDTQVLTTATAVMDEARPVPAGHMSDAMTGTPPAGRRRGLVLAVAGVLVAALVALTVAVTTSGGGTSDQRAEVPDGVPTRYQEPLGDLHDAVHGGAR